MKAKYDIPAIHAKCIEWCMKPVFPYPWQHTYKLKRNFNDFLIISLTDDRLAILDPRQGEQVWETVCEFAHLIGLDVESYRIKETYKSAVERYLATIPEGQPLWEGSPFTHKHSCVDSAISHAYFDGLYFAPLTTVEVRENRLWKKTYYFLRLDQNPDYKID